MNEIWKDIPEYEGIYKVSNYGKVLSLKKNIVRKPYTTKKGYLKIRLSKRGKGKNYYIHQLVAICFLNHTPCGSEKVIDHIDHNPLNNYVGNLQIVSNRENLSRRKKKGTSKYTGVYWVKNDKKWRADIRLENNKKKYLGLFDKEYDAHLAYQQELKAYLSTTNNLFSAGTIKF